MEEAEAPPDPMAMYADAALCNPTSKVSQDASHVGLRRSASWNADTATTTNADTDIDTAKATDTDTVGSQARFKQNC